jgi:hypothetical protein
MNAAAKRSICVAIALAIVMSIALHETSAKGGTFHLGAWSPVSRAEATPVAPSRTETAKPEPLSFGGCGGTRYRQILIGVAALAIFKVGRAR